MNREDKPSLMFLLLSHHRPERLHRTIHVSIRGRNLYLCARCTGIWTGIISTLPVFLYGLVLPPLFFLSLLAVLPAPAMLDWITQSCKLRESRNTIRIVTGYPLGIGWGLFFVLPAKGMFYLFLLALIILCAYIFSVYIIAWKTNFLDNYFD